MAPFDIHLIALNYHRSDAVREAALELYKTYGEAGKAVLLDDREDRPGAKFADADLIGIPHRIVIGERGLKNGEVEYKQRRESDARTVRLEDAANVI